MLALKLPLAGLIYIVWWAIKQEPEDATNPEDDGGIKRHDRPHPPKPFPRLPRRGPHGDPPPAAPARVRTVRARARSFDH
jgi:hypothetical protein